MGHHPTLLRYNTMLHANKAPFYPPSPFPNTFVEEVTNLLVVLLNHVPKLHNICLPRLESQKKLEGSDIQSPSERPMQLKTGNSQQPSRRRRRLSLPRSRSSHQRRQASLTFCFVLSLFVCRTDDDRRRKEEEGGWRDPG